VNPTAAVLFAPNQLLENSMMMLYRNRLAGQFAFVSLFLIVPFFAFISAASLHAQKPAIDFSYAGFEGGQPLPAVAAAVRIAPSGHDDQAAIQQAIDDLAARPANEHGFRGAVVLAAGRFHINSQILLRTSGVVLRGAGEGKTILVAEGSSRRPLIEAGSWRAPRTMAPVAVVADAPTGARLLQLASVRGLAVGAHVVITRPSTAEWIAAIGMTNMPGKFGSLLLDWKAGSRDLVWDRVVESVNVQANTILLDAPITMALEKRWGGGLVAAADAGDTVSHIAVEDLLLESSFNPANPLDEEHSWIAIQFNRVEDGWVRNVSAKHFASSAVRVNSRARRITVVDCHSLAPVSELAGYRRQSFVVNGQQILVARATAEDGMNDFASGMLAAGPNVFLDCIAHRAHAASGAFESLATGVLYEQVHVPDAALELVMDLSRAQGAGWTAANSLLWNADAPEVDALGPPDAANQVVASAHPLFAEQLFARTHRTLHDLFTADLAMLNADQTLPLSAAVVALPLAAIEVPLKVAIEGGRFVLDGRVQWGESQTEAWWKGDIAAATAMGSTGSSITRFMPGVTAPGQTEDLAELADRLHAEGATSIQVNPGLWYDRRRDEHTMERRLDANVWAPFFESPWSRSGQGKAWDGLSRYDLSRFNPWYFERHKAFAREAARTGLLIFYDLYNTHNVLELGPHWMDYPWRPANNINNTGLPEPPPLRHEDRNDVGNEFFSVTTANMRTLHRAYILHTLDELGDQPNVIFGVAYQYAGPLGFQQFFLDTIAEWEQLHHKSIRVALTTSKQTTDAIMADPVRNREVAVIDMRYWQTQPDGLLFAPVAGVNRAFREQIMKAYPGYMDLPPTTTEVLAYQSIRAYRSRHPQVALMPMINGGGILPVLMAGAAGPSALHGKPEDAVLLASAKDCTPTTDAIPRDCAQPFATRAMASDSVVRSIVCRYLSTDLARMEPVDGWTADPEHTWVLAQPLAPGAAALPLQALPVLINSISGPAVELFHKITPHAALWINPRSAEERPAAAEAAGSSVRFSKPDSGEWLLLLR